ncbi:predicted protein, partial [Nematostella vectensis]
MVKRKKERESPEKPVKVLRKEKSVVGGLEITEANLKPFVEEVKKLLQASSTLLAGLTRLRDAFRSSSNGELQREFIRGNSQCPELFKVLDKGKQQDNQLEIKQPNASAIPAVLTKDLEWPTHPGSGGKDLDLLSRSRQPLPVEHLFKSLPLPSVMLSRCEMELETSIVSSLLSAVIPCGITRTILSHGVQHSSPNVKHQSLQVLLLILERSLDVVDVIQNHSKSHQSNKKAPLQLFRVELLKRIPDVMILISLRQNIMQGKTKSNPTGDNQGGEQNGGDLLTQEGCSGIYLPQMRKSCDTWTIFDSQEERAVNLREEEKSDCVGAQQRRLDIAQREQKFYQEGSKKATEELETRYTMHYAFDYAQQVHIPMPSNAILSQALQAMFLYQELEPSVLTGVGFDLTKLLSECENVPPEIQDLTLKVLLMSQPGVCRWYQQ